jgi:DNA polymerase I-like protein with 3'-5' exonuclease and polymerase domains
MMERIIKYKNAFPILQIHDAAVFECWEDDAEALLADVKECFTQEHEIEGVRVKFPIDAKIADSWADL